MNIRVGTEQACRNPSADADFRCLREEKGGELHGQQVGLSPQEDTRSFTVENTERAKVSWISRRSQGTQQCEVGISKKGE
jgi:hypothetical protein